MSLAQRCHEAKLGLAHLLLGLLSPVSLAVPTALSLGRAEVEAPSKHDPERGCFLEGATSLQGAWLPCFHTHPGMAATVSGGAACMGM